MGANKLVQGSYYNSGDKDDHAIYWYSFDSVLLRPYYIDKFNWDYFEIIEKTENHNFVPNTTIDKEKYSDHLPYTPRAILVYTSCIHHFIGCDLNLVYKRLREKY